MIRLLFASCLLALLSSCAGSDAQHKSSQAPSAPGTEGATCCNAFCPMKGEAVQPSHTTQFGGQTVGFCCDNCRDNFNNLNADAKNSKMTNAMRNSGRTWTPAAPGTEGATCCNTYCPMKGEAVQPGHTTQFGGETVGFCCDNCEDKFESLSLDAKTSKMTTAMKYSGRTWAPKN